MITKNEKGNIGNMLMLHCFNSYLPVYYAYNEKVMSSSERAADALSVWDQASYSQTMPTLTFTEDESAQVTTLVTEISTYATEAILKWVVSEAELTDESWAQFQSTLIDMGIEDVMEIYQDAYDRYLA